LRGAFLDRTGDKYSFSVYRFTRPLYEPAGYIRQADEIHRGRWKVYEPYFEPLLFDSLAEDVFADLGRITAVPEVQGIDRFTALVLWGRIEQATELVNECERKQSDDAFWRNWVEKQRWMLAHGIPALCAEYHKKELETAKAMKLGDIWEPSPFPVELSRRDRESRVSEPLFVTTPWVGLPPNLWDEMPDNPGEIRFTRLILDRGGRKILWMPLPAEAAEERHRAYQTYALGARLGSGTLACLRHSTGWSPHDPEQPTNLAYTPTRSFHLDIYSSSRISASFDEEFEERDIIKMRSVDLYDDHIGGSNIWHAFNSLREREISVHDSRSGEKVYTRRSMTDSDLSLCRFPLPSFGDVSTLLERVRAYLEREGINGPF
jgi:hypothetical protein